MVGCARSLCETLWVLKAVKVTCISGIAGVMSVTTGPCTFAEMHHISPLLHWSFVFGTAEQHMCPLMIFCRF